MFDTVRCTWRNVSEEDQMLFVPPLVRSKLSVLSQHDPLLSSLFSISLATYNIYY